MDREASKRTVNESINQGSGFSVQKIHELLQLKAGVTDDLRLDEDGRELVFTSKLKNSPKDASDITGFLFDHAVLLACIKTSGKTEEIEVYRRPIPLKLLQISTVKGDVQTSYLKRAWHLIPLVKSKDASAEEVETWPITFRHLGKTGYELTLYASNQADQRKWPEHIDVAQQRLGAQAEFFNNSTICSKSLFGANTIKCATPFDHGRKILYGTDDGVYLSGRGINEIKLTKVLDTRKVTQINILEEQRLLLVLANKTMKSYALNNVETDELPVLKSPDTIQTNCSFFKAGICMGKDTISCVKSGSLSTTVKLFHFDDDAINGISTDNSCRTLRLFKEFYIPREIFSLRFLKAKLCVASSRGFEVVSLDTLETQLLLDETDATLNFTHEQGAKPFHIARLDEEFIVNYDQFSFFVDRSGRRTRPEFQIAWEGRPQSFALSYPWIFAFDPTFIELRNVKTGALYTLPHKNIRMLHSSVDEMLLAYEDENAEDMVESISF